MLRHLEEEISGQQLSESGPEAKAVGQGNGKPLELGAFHALAAERHDRPP